MSQDLLQRIANLEPHKRAALLQKLQQQRGTTVVSPDITITPRLRSPLEEFPLSYAQQRMWFLYQLEPGNAAYHLFMAVRLRGQLNRDILKQSMHDLGQRHEILRTTFPTRNGQPVQVIHPQFTLSIPYIDLRYLPPDQQHTTVDQQAYAEVRRSFDLDQGPLIRMVLLQLGEAEHVCLLTLHHIIADGWSIGVLIRDLSAFYTARVQSDTGILPPLPIQYADYACWQREWLPGNVHDKQLAYWQRQLAAAPPMLELPTDYPRPAAQTFQGAQYTFALPPELTDQLNQLSRRQGVTLFMTLLAAFKVLLYRYTNQTDILVGTPIANRGQTETHDLIGLFLNTLVLRTEMSDLPSFRILLDRVRRTALEAYAHQDLPFATVVEALRPTRSLQHTPLFQVLFILQNMPMETMKLPGLALEPLPIEVNATTVDMTLSLVEEDGLKGTWEYNTDLFSSATITRMAIHFETLLQAIVTNPDTPISQLDLLPVAEKRILLDTWNNSHFDYPQNISFPQLFEQQVARTPDRTAVVCDDVRLTYQQLNERANHLAWQLVVQGIGPEEIVPILATRGSDFLAAILGVFKAGGAYLPLDPRFPAARIQQILAQSQPPLILVEQQLLPLLEKAIVDYPAPDLPRQLVIETLWSCDGRTENLPVRHQPSNLAYVIFTSGSTGKPKGAMVEQQGMLNHLYAKIKDLALQSTDRVAQNASQSFDISVWQFLVALLLGGEVHILRDEVALDPMQLLQRVADEKITILEIVPSLLQPILAEITRAADHAPNLKSLRWLIPTGEALPPKMAREWLHLFPTIPLLNAYGPTECSDDVTHYVINQPPDLHIANMPIGRPVANMQMYILDEQWQPVPVGVAGELYVGGIGVGRGYLYEARRTAQQFVPHPFSLEPGARLYKTGDLVRYLPDGDIEFLGRVDYQVKIRGYRIELGEIEAALRQHEAIREVVVVAREDTGVEKYLAAYVVREESTVKAESGVWSSDFVSEWQTIYDDAYQQQVAPADPTFNTASWDSSYTGQPFPVAEMHEYVTSTVEAILALKPQRVLEIGCGTGLLLFRIAPHCQSYYGTDISQVALDYVQEQAAFRADLPPLILEKREANHFEGWEAGQFDAVILNSIVQLFPDADYLHQVLTGAVRLVRPGGFIFIGDVRHLHLLEIFHTSVQLYRAEPGLDLAFLRQQVQRAIANEKELLIDPAYFTALQENIAEISSVQIHLKRGRILNEFTRFRYNALLFINCGHSEMPPSTQWLDWQEQAFTLERLRQLLAEVQPDFLALTHVSNGRLVDAVAAGQLLADGTVATVGQLREQITHVSGVDPESFWELETLFPYQVNITWRDEGKEGFMDVLLHRKAAVSAPLLIPASPPAPSKHWSHYVHTPRQTETHIIPQLRQFLREKLPEYMIPSVFVFLEELPLTPNGKINRRALPAPQQSRVLRVKDNYVPPRNSTELKLTRIWEDVLDIQPIGVQDDFFELGGHSIIAIRLMAQIEEQFYRELPLSALFQGPTIESLAELLTQETHYQYTGPVITFRSEGTATPFFCVHPGGGTVLCYQNLARHLDPGQPFYGIEAIGLNGQEMPVNQMSAMAARYVAAVRQVQPEGPYRLGGWCIGGLIAYEMAQQLVTEGQNVELLALFDTAMHVRNPFPDVSLQDKRAELIIALSTLAQIFGITFDIARIEQMDAPAFIGHIWQQAMASDLIPPHLAIVWDSEEPEPDLVMQLLQYALIRAQSQQLFPPGFEFEDLHRLFLVQKAIVEAELTYAAQPYTGSVILFRAADHPPEQAADLGWGQVVPDKLNVHTVPGDHNSIIEDENHVRELASALSTYLAEKSHVT